MKKIFYAALAATCLFSMQQSIASGWDNLSQRQLQQMQRQLSTAQNATAFSNTLRGFYTTYGDPDDSDNPYVNPFLQNAANTWRSFFRTSGNFPSYNRIMSTRTPVAPASTPAPVIPPAVTIAGRGVIPTPVWDGTNYIIVSGTGATIATWNGTEWASTTPAAIRTATPAGTPAANISHNGTTYVMKTIGGSTIATWNGTDWVGVPGIGGSSTPTGGTLTPTIPAGIIPTPPSDVAYDPVSQSFYNPATGPAAAPVLTFQKLSDDSKKIKPQPATLEKFWANLSDLNPEVFSKFNVKKELLLQKLNALPILPAALIAQINGLPAGTFIESRKAAHQPIIQELITASPMTYFNLATGSIPKMMQAIYQASLATGGDFETNPNIQTFKADMIDLITQDPTAYTIKKQSDYFDLIDLIPGGDFQNAFRATLKQTLELAKAMKFAKNNPINLTPLAVLQANATNTLAALTTALTDAQREINAGTLTDPDAVARVQPLYDAAKKAASALTLETSKVFESSQTTINGIIKTVEARAPQYSPIGAITKATADLSTELATYMQNNPTAPTGGPILPGPTPITPVGPAGPTAQTTITTPVGQAGSQFPLEAPINYTGPNPFARTALSPIAVKEQNNVADNALSGVRIGILKTNYDKTPQGTTPLVNADGGYDLYIWGPDVADYTKDICIDKRTLETKARRTTTYAIALRFQNFGTQTPAKATKLYKVASFSRQEILDVNPATVDAIDLATPGTQNNLTLKLQYIYQMALKPTDYNL